VASPVYKQHFCLRTGICMEDMSVTVPVWRVTVRDGRLFVTEGER
jgi:nitrite reductase/ring-hydroxylating ferredoxin subunit